MAAAAAAIAPSSWPLPRFQHDNTQPELRELYEGTASSNKPDLTISDSEIARDSATAVSYLLKKTVLKASPYAGPEHILYLDNLETQSRLMALALSSLSPARPDYATAAYQQAFKWEQVIAILTTLAKEQRITWKKQSFYVVEFRSKLKADIDNDRLYLLDKQSHMEATASGGLLKYWYGSPDSERYNLATCKDIRDAQLFLQLTSPRSLAKQRRRSQWWTWTLA